MDVGFIFGSSVSIWDMDENEKVKIGIKMCEIYQLFLYMDLVEWKIA